MRTVTKQYKVYKFTELSDSAKQKALEDHANNLWHDWWDSVFEDAKAIGKLMGIAISNIYFSGFSSQGDGACFEGHYSYRKGSVKDVMSHAPQDEKLHEIVRTLANIQKRNFYQLSARVKQRGHYYHSRCTTIDVYRDSDTHECSDGDEDALAECLRDFMNWIYRQLEQEYEWMTSEEYLADHAEANEYEFLESGKLF